MAATGHAATRGAPISVAKTKLGTILVNAQGRTLYMFASDKNDKSACYGSCATYWPPLLTSSAHPTGKGAKAALLGTTMRSNGKLQVTYNRHPLYLYVQDTKAGQTHGEGLNVSGGLWWAVSPAGAVVKKAPAATGGGGYGGGYGK
jgi:predicted lipoprotein with Yx(FWY)xxD motif